MPPTKRKMEDSLQAATTGAGQSSTTSNSPTAGRQKRPKKEPKRYGFRKELIKSPYPPPAEKAAEGEVQPKEVIVDLTIEKVRPSDVGQNDDQPYPDWQPTFRY